MFRLWLVFVGCFSLLCYYPVSVESSSPTPSSPSWNSWFGSDDEQQQEGADDDAQQHNPKKTLVSPIVNRELEASVIAHGWPTSPQSVFCEAAAYYKSNNNNGNGKEGQEEESWFYDRLAETLSSLKGGEEDSPWKFTYRTATDAVLRAVGTDDDGTTSSGSSESALLEWSLAMRASSPACELHRQLARQALQQQQQQLAKDLDGFLILYPAGKVIALDDEVDDWSSLLLPFNDDENHDFDPSSVLLPDEVPIVGGGGGTTGAGDDDDAPSPPSLVILHANLGTPTFVRAYQRLKQLQGVRFVVRHLGMVDFEDQQKDTSSTAAAVTALQGYGVRLDIRNVEYKVFDDGGDEGDEEHQGWVNLTALALNEGGGGDNDEPQAVPAQFLAGVNLTALFTEGDDDGDDDENQQQQRQIRSLLLAELWNVHDAHQHYAQIVPPVWQRRQLPLQAAAVIAGAADPLQTLQEVSQDLPSLASTLVHIKIPPTIHALAKTLEQNPKIGGRSGAAGKLYINGRVVSSLTSPSWNVFKLLQILQEEMQATRKLQETLSPYLSAMTKSGGGASAAALLLQKVQEAWIMGDASFLERYKPKEQQKSKEDLMMMEEDVDDEEDDDDMDGGGGGAGSPSSSEASLFRIDVGRGWRQAVLYLNDLERDPEYAQWTRSLQQFLMNMQFGMPPSIRRNLFTFLAVMDPAQHSADNPAVLLGLQLLQQSQFPARIGMLVVAQADIDACQAWVASSDAQSTSATAEKSSASSASPPCPVPIMFEETPPTMETLASTPGTAQAAHRIMVHFYHEYSTTAPGSWIAYMEYFGTMIIEKRNQAKMEAASSSSSTEEEETTTGDHKKNADEKKTKFIPTVADLIDIHCELVENMQMGVTEDEARPKAIQALVGAEDETNDKTIGLYGKSVRFAVDKGLRPGMGFLNGRPIPSDPDASEDDNDDGSSSGGQATEAMQTLFTSEQQVVFGMIYKGAIRDHAPKSVYGKLLTGPNVYPKSHPLLFANDNSNSNQDAYLQAVHHGFGADNSALVVKHIGNDTTSSGQGGEVGTPSPPDAYVAVEGYLDWSTQTGLRNVQTLLSLASEFDGTVVRKGGGNKKNALTRVQLAVQFIPSTSAAAGTALCPLLASNAGTLGVEVLQEAVQKVLDATPSDGEANILTLEDLLGDDLDEAVRQNILASVENGPCRTARALEGVLPSNNLVAVNGRIYAPTSPPSLLTRNDLDLLFQLELERAQAVTTMLTPSSEGDGDNNKEEDNQLIAKDDDVRAACDAVGRTAAFLAVAARSGRRRSNILHYVNALEQQITELPEGEEKTNPLRFSWNNGNEGGGDATGATGLKVQITAVVDPVSEAAQRMSPLLVILRDHLKLPVHVLLTPATLIDGDSKVPITSYYRFVADPKALPDDEKGDGGPMAHLNFLPTNHVLTLRMDVPEPWDVQQTAIVQDTDNLRCDINKGLCSDEAAVGDQPVGLDKDKQPQRRRDVTRVEYGLNGLLIFGQCYESTGSPPNGLQLNLYRNTNLHLADATTVQADSGGGGAGQGDEQQQQEVEIGMDGTTITQPEPLTVDDPSNGSNVTSSSASALYSDTLVMKNVGYWQLRANPGVWNVKIAEDSKGAKMFQMIEGVIRAGRIKILSDDKQKSSSENTKTLVMKDFVNTGEILLVKRRKGYEKASLFFDEKDSKTKNGKNKKKKRSLSSANENKTKDPNDDADDGDDDDVVHVFSLATGHLYERFLKIMMLSVTKRTSAPVKFWLFENFLSPTFKTTAKAMADRIGCTVEFVTYKWPEWLRGQSEKQRIIWGYKILFLDVLFPMSVKKIIYVDADQVVRGDLKELWDLDLKGAPYGYTPMCSSRETTLGYQFWRDGFWKTHLRDKPYHISALYVVDLETFRRNLVGDQLRSIYQQLSADPNSLANLDQDLPNYAQHQVPIHSLPQEWLWCESWCSDETKAAAKTIDLCNNPLHKEPKVSMAKRVISGPLFEESWVELDEEVERYEKEEFRQGLGLNASTTTSTS